MKLLSVCLAVLMLSACSNNFYRDMYESIKGGIDAKRTPSEKAVKPVPTYDEYKKEREEVTK